jgi:hypothetical protein
VYKCIVEELGKSGGDDSIHVASAIASEYMIKAAAILLSHVAARLFLEGFFPAATAFAAYLLVSKRQVCPAVARENSDSLETLLFWALTVFAISIIFLGVLF